MNDLNFLTRRRFLGGLIASVAAAGVLDKVPGMARVIDVARSTKTYGEPILWFLRPKVVAIGGRQRIEWSRIHDPLDWRPLSPALTGRSFDVIAVDELPAPFALPAPPDDGEILGDETGSEVAVLKLDGGEDAPRAVEPLGPEHEPA